MMRSLMGVSRSNLVAAPKESRGRRRDVEEDDAI